MKRRVFIVVFLIVLSLSVLSDATNGTIVLTFPDGTIVQMSVEDYRTLFMSDSADEATALDSIDEASKVPWPTYYLVKYPLNIKNGSQTAQVNSDNNNDQFWSEYLQVILDSAGQINNQTIQADTMNTINQLWGDNFTVNANAISNNQIVQLATVSPPQNETKEERIMAYLGPSRYYKETAAYRRNGFTGIYGLFIENSYIFVDMIYPSVGVRRTYFSPNVFQSTAGIPEVSLVGYPAVTTQSADARYGPGSIYDPFPEASIAADTALTVFFEESGYVFAEYEVGFELVRAWIDANSVIPR